MRVQDAYLPVLPVAEGDLVAGERARLERATGALERALSEQDLDAWAVADPGSTRTSWRCRRTCD